MHPVTGNTCNLLFTLCKVKAKKRGSQGRLSNACASFSGHIHRSVLAPQAG